MKTIKICFYAVMIFLAIFFLGYQFYIYNLKNSTQQDIDFIHQTIFENHPGPYNDQDPDFVSNMNVAYQVAKNSISTMKSSGQLYSIIEQYLACFHDVHLQFYPKVQEITSAQTLDYEHFSIKELANNIVWVTLPTFAPDKLQQKELEMIIDQIAKYRTSNVVVFDVRSNTGGNSQWGTKILDNLFGKKYVEQKLCDMNKNIEVDWRASQENVAYLSKLIDSVMDQFGANSPVLSEFKAVEQGMQRAYNQHQNFYTEHSNQQLSCTKKIDNVVTAKIIVVISDHCVSSCLDFIDEIKAMDPKTILIGETTKADSVYMEVRMVDVPSGTGKFQFPIKVYRNRPRGHNVPYVPDIAYPKYIHSAAEKDQWLLQTICFE